MCENRETCGMSCDLHYHLSRLRSLKHKMCHDGSQGELLSVLLYSFYPEEELNCVMNVDCSPHRLSAVPAVVYRLRVLAAVRKKRFSLSYIHTSLHWLRKEYLCFTSTLVAISDIKVLLAHG